MNILEFLKRKCVKDNVIKFSKLIILIVKKRD